MVAGVFSAIRPNSGNARGAGCETCGAELTCLSCGPRRDDRTRILELERQLEGCAIAARSWQEAVDRGEPFGDALKAVLTLRQNADAGFAELTSVRAYLSNVVKHANEYLEKIAVAEQQLAEAREKTKELRDRWYAVHLAFARECEKVRALAPGSETTQPTR